MRQTEVTGELPAARNRSVGLAVTKRAAEEMGRSIEVDTQKGEGSRFTVRFPAARSAGSAGGPPAGEPQQADQRGLDKPASP